MILLYISLFGKLLKDGLNLGDKAHDRHIKISIGLKNSIPASVRFCDKQADSSENVALVQAIHGTKIKKQRYYYLIEVYQKRKHLNLLTKMNNILLHE